MSDSTVGLPPDSTGKEVRTFRQTVGANQVEVQGIALCDPANATAVAGIVTSAPATNAAGLVTRSLPFGTEATAAKQDTGNASLASMLSTLTSVLTALQGTLTTSAAALPLPVGAATQATLASVLAALQSTLTVGLVGGTVEIANDSGSPLPVSGTVNVGNFPATSGTVTANAGLNLNTSALALEVGNLATLTAKDFATQTTLAAILAKIITSPATETTLAAILAKLITAPATETTLSALSDKIPALGGAAASASLPVVATVAGVTYTDRSGTITAGGTAQQLAAANASRKGYFIQNNSSGDIWINSVTTAVLSQPSLKIVTGAIYECPANGAPVTAISIIGATTGQAFSAREY